MKNKNIISIILLGLALQSCGAFTKVFKSSSKVKTSTEVEVSKEDKLELEDKSIITTKEKADTLIKSKAINIITNTPVNSLKDLMNLGLVKTDLVDIRLHYDTLSKILTTETHIKPQDIPVKFDKETKRENNIKASQSSKLDSSNKQNVLIKDSLKTKEPVNLIPYIVGSVIVLIGIGFTIKFLRK